jgi:hypothetical protein
LGNLRRAAKLRFAYVLGAALNDYLKAGSGQLPNDISELKPFLKYPADEKPVDDSVLQRYELMHNGKTSDFSPGESMIAEKGAVDEQYDTIFKIGRNGYIMEGVGKWNQVRVTNLWQRGIESGK